MQASQDTKRQTNTEEKRDNREKARRGTLYLFIYFPSELDVFRLVFLGWDDVALGIERPERIFEQVGWIVRLLHFTEPVPILSKARHNATGQFTSP